VLASLPANRASDASVGLPELPAPGSEAALLSGAAPAPHRARWLYFAALAVTLLAIGTCTAVWRSLDNKAGQPVVPDLPPGSGPRTPDEQKGKGTGPNPGSVQSLPASFALTGQGSSFIAPLMREWEDVYRAKSGQVVKYDSTGSKDGLRALFLKQVGFACTDAYLVGDDLVEADQKGGVVHVPLTMGAVVATYHLPPLKDVPLRFTGDVLAAIFLGEINRWNDPAIQACNPAARSLLPDLPITVVHRSDGSGTTSIWTDYLCQVSSKWKNGPGTGLSVKWPRRKEFVPAEKNGGVATEVKNRPGAIGYVELNFALNNTLPVAEIENESGAYVAPSLQSVSAAARQKQDFGPDLRYTLTNVKGKGVYPICGTTWAVLYKKQPGVDRRELIKFLRWAVHEGQTSASNLQYAPLPKELVEKIDAALNEVKAEP
jgi:phosphate transport system substrate-binding protein